MSGEPTFPAGYGPEGLLFRLHGFDQHGSFIVLHIEKEFSIFMDSRTGMSNIFLFFIFGSSNIRTTMSDIFCQMFKDRYFLSNIWRKSFNIPFAFPGGLSNILTGSSNIFKKSSNTAWDCPTFSKKCPSFEIFCPTWKKICPTSQKKCPSYGKKRRSSGKKCPSSFPVSDIRCRLSNINAPNGLQKIEKGTVNIMMRRNPFSFHDG